MNKHYKIGFIGCGKMASAIIKGVLSTGFLAENEILAAEISEDNALKVKNALNIEVTTDNGILARNCDVIVIATKPCYVEEVLSEIASELTCEKLIVSIAAGVSINKIENIVGENRVVRVMPNTPALVLEGMSGVCKGTFAKDGDIEFVMNLLSKIGKCIEVSEDKIDIVTAISGSGPAFFYKIIEEIARAGEKLGLDYEKSLLLATQTAIGSAKMIENRGEVEVQTLVNNVATKGGCTFVGVSVMNEQKSDELFFDVIDKTTQKACELGK
ncbi:MAG: pyrroline-5-carboxylate reductase [Candidatus Gastranaerophilales bacterium]